MESTPHFPVVVLRPSSAILNQERPVPAAVAALSTYGLVRLPLLRAARIGVDTLAR